MTQHEEIDEMEKTLGQMEHELQNRYSEMGKSLLELADHEQREISALVDDMIELRRRLFTAKGEIECGFCNAFNPADARFCKNCGSKLIQKQKGETSNEK